jgi:CheY-like chemotaxis protein
VDGVDAGITSCQNAAIPSADYTLGYVLVFDPVPDHCALINELLKRGELTGSCHSDPTRALETAHGAYPQAVVVDIEDIDEADAFLRGLAPLLTERRIPVIALFSGRGEADLPNWNFAAKIRKPIDQDTLVTTIRRALAQQV